MVGPDPPQNLIGDNAYDSDRLDAELLLGEAMETSASHEARSAPLPYPTYRQPSYNLGNKGR
jgi:hypothetical protein